MTTVIGRRAGSNSTFRDRGFLDEIIFTDENLVEAGYLSYLNMLEKKAVDTPEVKWGLKDFLFNTDTLSANATAATNILTVSNIDRWIVGDIWRNATTTEYFRVSGKIVNTSQIEVVRGFTALNSQGGTAAGAMTSGQTLIRLATAVNPQRSTKTQSRTRDLTEVTAFTQAFRYDLDLGREDLKHKYDIEKYVETREFRDFMLNVRKDLGRTFMLGEQGYELDGSDKIRTMKGIYQVPETYELDAGGVLYKQQLDRFLSTKAFRKGKMEKVLFAGNGLLASINQMADDQIVYNQEELFKDEVMGFHVGMYRCQGGGMLKLVEDRSLSETYPNDGVIVDMDQVQYIHFSNNGYNDDIHIVEKSNENDATNIEAYIYGQVGMTWGDESTHARIKNANFGSKGSETA